MLIVVDGPSGTGKNTLVRRLVPELHNKTGLHVFSLEENKFYSNNGKTILEARESGKAKGGNGDREMADAFARERSRIFTEHKVDSDINIANRGEVTTLAYQTVRGEISMEEVWQMHRKAGIPKPDLVVVTNCTPETALKRLYHREASSGIESGPLSGKVTIEAGASGEEQLERRRTIHEQYREVKNFLEAKGINVLELDTEIMSISEEVEKVVEAIS